MNRTTLGMVCLSNQLVVMGSKERRRLLFAEFSAPSSSFVNTDPVVGGSFS